MQELYGLHDNATIAHELKRPLASVVHVALGLLPRELKTGPWTPSETQELKRYLGACPTEVLASILGRSLAEVQAQIEDLGRTQREDPWSREEIVLLKRIYGSRTEDSLARILGRSRAGIQRCATELRLSKDKAFMRKLGGAGSTRMPRWSGKELEFFKKSFTKQSNLEIALRLGRSVKSVASKAGHLRLRKSSKRLSEMGRVNVNLRYLRS